MISPEAGTKSGSIERMNEDPTSDEVVLVGTDSMAQASPVTKTRKTASRPAGIDDIKPYAVRYQTDDHDDDDMVTKSRETRNGQAQDVSCCSIDNIEPYAVRYREDDDVSTERNTTEIELTQDANSTNGNIEPSSVRYGEDGDFPTERNTTESEHTQDVSSANVNIEPYAVKCGEDDDFPTERNTTESEHAQDASSANVNIELYAVRCGEDDDVPTERNITESAQTQDDSSANVNIEPYAVRYGEDDDVPTERNTTESEHMQDASSANVNIEPYSVSYGEDGDVSTERNTTESEHMQDDSSANVNIEPYAVRYGEDGDVSTERNTTESEHAQDASSANGNIEPYSVRYGEDGDFPTERNTTESEHMQDASSANFNTEPYVVRYGEDDGVQTERNTTESAQTQDASPTNVEPYAVRYGEDDDVSTESNTTKSEHMQDASSANGNIEPYAVRYGDDDDVPAARNTTKCEQTQGASPDNVNIQPYATAYIMGQDDVTSEGRNDIRTIPTRCSSSMDATNASVGQGSNIGVRDDRNQAPMPNGPQQDICGCRYRCECDAILTCIPLVVLAIVGSLIWAFFYNTGTRDTQMILTSTLSHVSDHPECCSLETTTTTSPTFKVTTANSYLTETAPTLSSILITSLEDQYQHNSTANGSLGEATPTLSSSPSTSRAPSSENEKPEKIVFGGLGTEPGKFQQACRVAVSGDNEIFVPDFYNRRIQVHNMSGVYLRLFPTVVPGKKVKMQPNGVAIDGEGHLWVAGVGEHEVHVVQYSRHGQPLSRFDVTGDLSHPEIAVDVANHKIIVTSKNEILVFQPNGSLHVRFRETQTSLISSVTTDIKGNILVTVIPNSIQVYNRHGVRLFTAGTCRRGQFPCHSRGICLDTSGRIVVANGLPERVDMYTSRGKFVRTLVSMENPWGVAMGRDGQLVVTSKQEGTVTIFPRQVIYKTGN